MFLDDLKEKALRVVLLIGSVVVASLLVEVAVRWNFYSESGNEGLAQKHLYRGIARAWKHRGPSGVELNRLAWEATYTERGQAVPEIGPREGYWAERIRPQQYPCGDLDACERTQTIPLLVTIDGRGFQHVGPGLEATPRVLFVGGSVAFGAYASTVETTYFYLLWRQLQEEFPGVAISVLARNGSVGIEDFEAYALRGSEVQPDMVVFINGLNDLMNRPGKSPEEGLRKYRRSVRLAAQLGHLQGVATVFVAQPFLGGKAVKTPLERRLLDLTTDDYEDVVNPWYRRLVTESEQLARDGGAVGFLDYSDLLAEEAKTTFADQWHFSDFGHVALAEALARDLAPLLRPILAAEPAADSE
ncbi:MAG: SGNH/GDSL hydrolase family protein [Acidobacteriota bacterium]